MIPGRLATALLLVVVVVVVGTGAVRLQALEAEAGGEGLLYLPNGKHIRVASLGHAGLLADMIYLWAIQYYSDYDRVDRYRYVEHVFGNVIAELDPHYIDAYWLGALILIVEAEDVAGGLRLLDLGIERNPDQWVLPYLAGWEATQAGLFDRAGGYFDRACAAPGAPAHVCRARAGVLARAGDDAGALREWSAILDDPASDAASRAIAERQVREFTVRVDLGRLRGALERFRIDNGRCPTTLDELAGRFYLAHVPRAPEGRTYRYDATRCEVSSASGRILGDG